jgi:hypothetical protein
MTAHPSWHPAPATVGRRLVLALLMLSLALPVRAQAPAGFEDAPVLRASDLAPADLLKGQGFTVDESVPVKGLQAHFTIRSDVGAFEAHGVEMLRIRAAEVGALQHLEQNSKTETFLKAAGVAAARPVQAAAHIVMNPVETAKGLPDGVGRFFDRVKTGAQRVQEAGSAPDKTDAERAADVTQRVGSISADAFGYEKERRDLARELKVDPYTTNPVLGKKLSDVAWVAFSGRLGVNTLVSVFVPGAIFLTGIKVADDWVWDTPPADLLKQAERRFADTGAKPADVQALIKNRWYSLTVLSVFSRSLEGLAPITGRAEAVALAASVQTEDEANFLSDAAMMLGERHRTDPLASMSAKGTVVGRTKTGAIVVPAPVDHLPWTRQVSDFARRPDLRAKDRSIWVRGAASPRARSELTALGWTVRERVKPAWMR